MLFLRSFLVIFGLGLLIYTVFVGVAHGWNLIPPFFAEIQAMTWQGQFNLDFAGFLLLSAMWTLWRNAFSPLGWGLSLLAGTGGMLFLCLYLCVLSVATGGQMRTILMGPSRA